MGASSSARGNWSRRRRLAALEASRFNFWWPGGDLADRVLLSAEERQRQIVARSCSRRWRVLWSPRPSATALTPGGACDLGRAAEQYEEPSNHGFTLSRPDGSREKRRQPARWGWYVGEPNVLFPAQPAL